MSDLTQLIAAILQALPVPVLMSQRDDGRVLYANPHAARAFGMEPDELVGSLVSALYADRADRARLLAAIDRGEAVTDQEVDFRRPDGSRFWALASVAPLEHQGVPVLCTTFVDITGRKRSASTSSDQLAETERRLATLLRNLPGMAYRCRNDRRWTMLFLSDGCRRLTGYSPDELMGNRVCSYAELIHPEDEPRVWGRVQRALERDEPFQVEYRIRRRDGETRWVWEQGVRVCGEGEGAELEGIVHDVTERRLAEEEREAMEAQMRAAQRMEAIGRLAGGVAHDFNNILAVIASFAGFVEEAVGGDDAARADVRTIREAVDRGARLTGQLLAFSRHQVQSLEVVEIDRAVAGLDKMLQRIIGEDVQLVTRLAGEPIRVRVDITHFEQVVMNLVVNARDAMPRGGTVWIETGRVEVPSGGDLPPGPYAVLRVVDTGVGMDPATQAQIFEPFFTTKPKGKGTGLGLSTVYGIVKQSDGHIRVRSEPGRGTTFDVHLPEVGDEPVSDRPRSVPPATLRGTETVLLAEDDGPVLRAAARILGRYGYDVLEAAGAEEALRLCERHRGTIHVLLTDVVMPRLDGRQLAERVASRRPGVRVVYMSGYTGEALVHHGMSGDDVPFVQKPFSPESLTRAVREALDGA